MTFQPEIVKIVCEEDKLALLKDPKYVPIIKMLRKRPMTVKEIEAEYNQGFEDESDKKSDKTLYRYLKELENAALVIPTGQRVVIGRTATETLYGRTAKIFYLGQNDKVEEHFSKNPKMISAISNLIKRYLDTDNLETDENQLISLLTKFHNVSVNEITKILETSKPEDLNIFTDMDFEDINYVLDSVGAIIILMKYMDLHEELMKSFRKKEALLNQEIVK